MNNPYQTSLFESGAFDMAALTTSINILPNSYGKLEALKLFPQKSVRTRNICVEEKNGVLNLLPTQMPGSAATVGTQCKRKMRSFTIPHIPHDDVILPEEVQGIRASVTLDPFAFASSARIQCNRKAKPLAQVRHAPNGSIEGIHFGFRRLHALQLVR